ncbi:hypothetical protein [Scytonema sp. NUACC26]|uniref:hypothetical protein n=1 Tax=Scytonema sp. NUACC26 TaxID=3140176 RepID=UPI0034DC83CD
MTQFEPLPEDAVVYRALLRKQWISEDAVAMIRTQYPEVVETLEVVTVGGVLAPNQVIALEYSQFLSST